MADKKELIKEKKLSAEQERGLLELALERYRDAMTIEQSETALALRDLQFAQNEDNCQWDDAIKKQRLGDHPPRPCLTINKIPEKIDQVEGEFRQLKPSFKLRPVDSVSDPKTADILSGIMRHIEYNSNARTAYNTSYNSKLHCGRGAWRIDIVDADDDPFVKDIKISRVPNALAIVVDPDAKEMDKSDAGWQFVIEEMSVAKFKATNPDCDLSGWDTKNSIYQGWVSDKTIRVAEYWYKENGKETFCRVRRNINGVESVITVPERALQGTDVIMESKEVERPKVKWCKMVCTEVIDGPHDWPSKYIPIVHDIGKEIFIGSQSKKRGMVRHAIVPQQMYNYWSSAQTEQIALQPKAPYTVTSRMIEKFKNIWDMANIKNFFYLPYEPDPQAPTLSPRREPPPQMSVAMASELNRMSHDIMSAMGIYQASLGDAGNEKSGTAIFARQRQGSMGTYVFVDNFGIAYVHSQKIIIDLIPYIYDTERIVRIIGPDEKYQTVPINARPSSPIMQGFSDHKPGPTGYINDVTVGKYDVMGSIGPSYNSQREELGSILGEIIKSMPPAIGGALLKPFVRTIDMPNSDQIVEEIQTAMESGNQPTFEQQMAMKKLELDGLKEMREAFEGKIEAMSKLMHAEAAEKGQQLAEISAFVKALSDRMQTNGNVNQPVIEGGI
jgi:hypothetical protein